MMRGTISALVAACIKSREWKVHYQIPISRKELLIWIKRPMGDGAG